jgi:2-oxoisovalerate dehydrogenase E1 component
MEVAISSAHASGTYPASDELTAQQMIEIYRLMFLSRAVDDREILLKRQ